MNPFNKLFLTAALGLVFAQSAAATVVTCSCEHQGSATDGLCEASPFPEQTATLYTYNQYLLGAIPWYEVPRYRYTWTQVGGAALMGAEVSYAPFASYQCQAGDYCNLHVTVHEYADPSTIAGMQASGYPTYVGERLCAFGTGGEGGGVLR